MTQNEEKRQEYVLKYHLRVVFSPPEEEEHLGASDGVRIWNERRLNSARRNQREVQEHQYPRAQNSAQMSME